MACAGIDFGSRKSVVAIARRGGVDICANEASNRASHSIVSFAGEERHIGEAASNFQAQNPRNTITGLQRLLGAAFSSSFSTSEIARLTAPCQVTAAGGVAAKVKYGKAGADGDVPDLELPFEALSGMLFSHLLGIASAEYKAPVKDCVVTVPGYYTDAQRRAVVAAATIGNVNVLRVANEHAAIALAYGIFRTADLPKAGDPENPPVKVAFVDVGDASTQAFIVSFTNTSADIQSVVYDPSLGGRDFDDAIAALFAKEFKEKYGIDALSKPRPKLRLLKEAEKLKRVLSANAQAALNVECLMDDIDVTSKMNRDQFEELAKPLVERVSDVCHRAIAAAGLAEGEKLLSVEIIGAGTRVPAIKTAVTEAFAPLGAPLKNTLNMDECVARGAALMAAMLSPAFKVRDYDIFDITSYAIDAEKVFDSGIPNEPVTLIKPASKFPCTKAMTFKAPGPFTVNISYHDASELTQGEAAAQICSYKVDAPVDPEAKIRAKVKVNSNGIVESASVTLSKEVEIWEDIPASTPAPAAESPAPVLAAANGDAGLPAEDGEAKGEVSMDSEPAPASAEATGDEEVVDAAAATAPEPVLEKKLVKKTETTDLVVTEAPVAGTGLSLKEVMTLQEAEAQMRATDTYQRERSDAMNALEGYVYDLRSRLDAYGDFKDFAPEDVRMPLKKETDDAEEWIYSEEGEAASKSAFIERKDALVKKVAPIVRRKREREERPAAASALEAILEKYKKLAVPTVEEYAHIEQAEKDKALSCVEAAAMWLKTESAKQEAAPLDLDPTLTCAAINAKRIEVDALCGPIEKTPKPLPPKVEEAEVIPEAANGDGDAKANGTATSTGEGEAEVKVESGGEKDVESKMEVDPSTPSGEAMES